MDFGSYYQQHLSEVKWGQNGEGKVRCPFHEDHRPSLSVNRNTGLWYCHSCAEGGTAKQFADRLGVDPPSATTRGPDAAFVYTDEEGKPLFRSVRWPPKNFHLQRYVGPGRWEKGIKGVRRVPYRLHKLVKASGLSFIPEGEKDVHSLERLGLTATTNPMGAGKWRPEYNEFFRGHPVAIPADNDEPGRQHAHDVARNLHGIAASVKVLEFPDLPEHGDVSDAIARGLTKEQLLARVEQTAEWTPASMPPGRADGQTLGEVWPGRIPPEMQGLRLPAGYTVKGERLYQGEEHVVTYTPILPARILQDLDTDEQKIEVLLLGAGRPRRLQVAAQDLGDVKRILTLRRHGLDVTSLTSRDLVRFISDYTHANPLERIRQTCRLGWITWEDGAAYVLHEIHPADAPITFAGETEETRLLRETFRPTGTLAGIRKLLTQVASFAPVVTALCAAVAPAVREILALDARSFILHLEGPTTTGKTLTQRVALSAWVKPALDSPWLVHGHATYAGLERLCLRTFGLPVVIEDAHLVRDQDRPALVYAVGNEAWKARGGDRARPQTRWRGAIITSGELGLLDETSLQGVGARLIVVTGRPFGPVSEAQRLFLDDEVVPALQTNHGLLGVEVITYLLHAAEAERHDLRKYWEGCRNQFAKEAADHTILARQAPVWALLGLTARIITKTLGLEVNPSLEDQVWETFAQAQRLPPPDPVRHAYEYILSWAESNRAFFYIRTAEGTSSPGESNVGSAPTDQPGIGERETTPKDGRPVYGLINERQGWIAFWPNVLKDVLARANLGSAERFLRAWRDRGWLLTREGELGNNVKVSGRLVWSYVLKRPGTSQTESN
ncbi:MAG: DUF927 domain-containing protein [Candidatus Methylomirabilota bacterium]|jgi:hypothetical protein